MLVAWAFRYLIVVVLVGASFALLNRERPGIVGAVSPPVREDARTAHREIHVRSDDRGYFFVRAVVQGVTIPFLVDTGASVILLSPVDARRIGLRPAELDYAQRIMTANGEIPGAEVTLREIRIGQLQVFDLPATVHGASLPISLLGTSFLRRLEGYEVANDHLILRW